MTHEWRERAGCEEAAPEAEEGLATKLAQAMPFLGLRGSGLG